MIRSKAMEIVKSNGHRQPPTTKTHAAHAIAAPVATNRDASGVVRCRTMSSFATIGILRDVSRRNGTIVPRPLDMTTHCACACGLVAPNNFFGGRSPRQSWVSQGPRGVALPIGPWELRRRRFLHCTSFHTGSC
jgi:hypothetical protein